MDWIPVTSADEQDMLRIAGAASIEGFFEIIPEALRLKEWSLPEGLSEFGLRRHLERMAEKNCTQYLSFLGGGYYDHYIPAAVDALAARSEFYTAYTPYQPECAQGTLQAIYEYQSVICRLTDMECANASLYDGGTAVFEAVSMACRVTGRRKALIHPSLHPVWRQMLETHLAGSPIQLVDGEHADAETACVVAQNPAFLGDIHDFTEHADQCHEKGALLVMAVNPISLGIVKTPGAMGADIVVAEGQSLGLPLGFGGPYLGILAAKKKHIRKMPGRIAAATTDTEGRRGYVLTLQAREQHIRREKALSNICSNQALCALRALIHLCLLGKRGLEETAKSCFSKSEYLKGQLDFLSLLNKGATFNEFAVRLPLPAEQVCAAMAKRGFLAGLPLAELGRGEAEDLLIAVTEKRSREELDYFVKELREVCTHV
ncbi:MAG: aminomethyl-transferring glycine dehydrogenase subunit GcvPA [Candidatus Hydrogenedentes bacterium]|jgi:glycine dehydrogenase subunit 1|nr:aminomethyl-transferring glycine dehydrogenase subunit GcvPA [Candidatus Hydrogenedentota bacterium]